MGVVAVKDGGPAFPQIETEYSSGSHEYTGNTYSYGGMTLRDYFAGQALAGLIAEPLYEPDEYSCCALDIAGDITPRQDQLAVAAYLIADAMLKAREES